MLAMLLKAINECAKDVDIQIKTITVGKKDIKVKASGGIRDWEAAVGYLDQGCSRLGLSATEAVLTGAPAGDGNY